MAYFELLEDMFIGGSIKTAGTVVVYDCPKPGANLKPSTREAYEAQPVLPGDHVPRDPPAGITPFDPSRPFSPSERNG